MQASMLAWVVTYLVHSTLLVLGAWLLEQRWRDRPERMSAVWKTALVGGFFTATLQSGLGVAPVAGRWDLAPELTSREPGPSVGAEAVAAPAEAPVAAPVAEAPVAAAAVRPGMPVLAAARESWPPPGAVVRASGSWPPPGVQVAAVLEARPSWPPPTEALAGGEAELEAPSVDAREADVGEAQRAIADDREGIPGQAERAIAEDLQGVPGGAERAIEPVPAIAAAPVVRSERGLAVADAEHEREPMLAAASVGSVPPSASPGPATASSPWAAVVAWVMAIAVIGSLLGLVSVGIAFIALRRQLAGRRRLAEGTLPTLLEGLRRRAGIDRSIRLTVAPRVQVPMAVGVLRPEIVVPIKAAQGLPPAHQESLLAHELAHVLRHDPAWRLAALLVERVFFFQPLNRLASRRVAQSAEYLCDDWAARHTRQPLALATCLTEIATWIARTGPVAATMAGPRSILGRRVQRLLQPARASARPWWLSAALGLPLLAVVVVAPGVGAHAKGDKQRSKTPERVVVIDENGRRHELRPHEGGAIVVQERDGELVVRNLDDGEAAEPVLAGGDDSPRSTRKASRQEERARAKARREARKELRRAFRAAKARGDAAPSQAEVDAILRRAGVADDSHPEHMEVHVVVPGEMELHGRVPIEVEALEDGIQESVEEALEGLQALEGLEGLEELKALERLEDIEGLEELGPALEQLERELEHLEGLEELGPVLEQIQEELEDEGIDVVIRRRPGGEPKVHIVLSPDQRRALEDAQRMHRQAEREHGRAHAMRHREHHHEHAAEARREAARERARTHGMRQGEHHHEHAAEARREAMRRRAEHDAEREAMRHEAIRRRAEHDAARMQREEIRRQIERAHRDRQRRQSEPELPTVWIPAPEAPVAWGAPVPAPEAPPAWGFPVPMAAPEAPLPPGTPVAPEAPIVWRKQVPGTPAVAPVPPVMGTPGVPAVAPAPPKAGKKPARIRGQRLRAPSAPRAPLPPAAPLPPTAPSAPGTPSPDVGPVVWVSWPPPTKTCADAQG